MSENDRLINLIKHDLLKGIWTDDSIKAFNVVENKLKELDSLHHAYNELNQQHDELCDIVQSTQKIFIKNIDTGTIREYGSNCHDSLMLLNGGLYYYNLQCGDGTFSKSSSYKFCDKDGNTDFNNDYYDNFYMMGFLHKGYQKKHQESKKQLLKILMLENV